MPKIRLLAGSPKPLPLVYTRHLLRVLTWTVLCTSPASHLLLIRCVCVLSHVQLFTTPWTVACQAPLSREFSRQENWSGMLFPLPPNPTGLGPILMTSFKLN